MNRTPKAFRLMSIPRLSLCLCENALTALQFLKICRAQIMPTTSEPLMFMLLVNMNKLKLYSDWSLEICSQKRRPQIPGRPWQLRPLGVFKDSVAPIYSPPILDYVSLCVFEGYGTEAETRGGPQSQFPLKERCPFTCKKRCRNFGGSMSRKIREKYLST